MPAEVLFGRDDVLADLARVVGRAEAGRGGLVLVHGEAGVGKTALVEAAIGDRAALWGRATASEVAPHLHAWDQVLRSAQRRGLLSGAIDEPLGATAADDPVGTGSDRFLRVDGVLRAVRSIAERGPLVVVLDDAQWADDESLLVVEMLAAELVSLPLALVMTARPGALGELSRPDLTIDLRGLGADGVANLLAALTGGEPDPSVVAVALDHTGGNPFFVTEVARWLGDRALDPDAWQGAVPEGARAVIRQRVATLSSPTREALVAAAVSNPGLDIDSSDVAAVLGVASSEVDAHVVAATAVGLLLDGPAGNVSFAHSLTRDAVLAEASNDELRRLHSRFARVRSDRSGADAATIATHHLAAGEAAEASPWAVSAASAASAASAYDDAAAWLERALAHLPDPEPSVLLDLRLRRAEALCRAGRVDAARDQFLGVANDARGVDDRVFGRAVLGVGAIGSGFEVRLLDQAQVALLVEAQERVGSSPAWLASRLRARLSVALTLQEEHERRDELAESAVLLAREAGDDAALVHALAAWCDANADPTHVDERLTASAEMIGAAVRSGDPELELLARRFRIVALMERGVVSEAAAEIDAFARLADALRQPAFRWYARLTEGMLAFLAGDLEGAETLARVASAEGRRAGSRNARMLADGALLAPVLRQRGDHAGFLAMLTEANRAGAEAERGIEFAYPLFLVGYGVDRDLVHGILAALDESHLGSSEHDALYLHIWASLGDAAAYAGDARWARLAEDRLRPFADLFVLDGTASFCTGPVAATLGRIAASRFDADEARRWFDRALALLPGPAPLLRERIQNDRAELDASAETPRTERVARFTRQGETWWLSFEGAETRMRDSKGLRDLAGLVGRPGQEIHCLDLVALAEGQPVAPRAASGDLGPALDATARRQYEARVRELTEQIDDAEAAGRDGAAARLDEERAFVLRELAKALGLGGRARPHGSEAERARKAVTMRIRDAIGRIEAEVPDLAHHLRRSVRTGAFCAYEPEHPVDWLL